MAEIVGPDEGGGSIGLGPEVSDAIDGTVVLAVSGVPLDSDPLAGVALHGSHVRHRPDSPGIAGRVDSLAESELGLSHALLRLPQQTTLYSNGTLRPFR